MKLTEKQIIESMRVAYLRRLHEVLGETDVKDKRGNIVISPGLKVRHKKSQFEYTVASVKEDPKSGDVVITLKSPELPRFTPKDGQEFVGEETPLLTAVEPAAPPADDMQSDKMRSPMATEAKRGKKKQKSEGGEIEKMAAGDPAPSADVPDPSGGETVFVVDEKEFKKDYEVK